MPKHPGKVRRGTSHRNNKPSVTKPSSGVSNTKPKGMGKVNTPRSK